MKEREINASFIGKKIIENAVKLDESLVDILKIEVRRLKQSIKSNNNLDELQRTNNLIKNIIIALTITDERIQTGIDLCMNNSETE
ncbi:MAG TPA: hypothetical protein PK733_05215 [Clostridiales bacterium]|nr:hypothetical protein [Clostridiales bacterium]